MSPEGELLHVRGMECCDKGYPVKQEEGYNECRCFHAVSVEQIKTPKDPISKDNEYLVEPECSS